MVENEPIFQARAREGRSWYEFRAWRNHVVQVTFGPGTVSMMSHFFRAFEAFLTRLPPDDRVMSFVVDARHAGLAGPAVELGMLKWLFRQRWTFRRLAVAGLPGVAGVALRLMLRIFGLRRIAVFDDAGDAWRWAAAGSITGREPWSLA